ncbi:hypothetical protein FM104_05365 [Microbacterium esteraromaticum]|uniref:Uncharacterized protein n=1 Tax=Microbacterium esteraromaticum TaxID=57043 RepID=A0A1R4J3F2_9MICO|nr:hypothetical protein [Microbacterium esteraromaticum]SJN26641.1 hypothetical protein FM104_05365 [Microbacterium esteraromaticum]
MLIFPFGILGVGVLGIGAVVVFWNAYRRPAFFRGETLGTDAPASVRRR